MGEQRTLEETVQKDKSQQQYDFSNDLFTYGLCAFSSGALLAASGFFQGRGEISDSMMTGIISAGLLGFSAYKFNKAYHKYKSKD